MIKKGNQWIDVLFTTSGEAFDIQEISHRIDIAKALAIAETDLQVVEATSDIRDISPRISLPAPIAEVDLKEQFKNATTTTEKINILAKALRLLQE